ncbi:MAG TPA: UvrD-helicase domain-containing protein [Tenuifilaceae bacterium]|jgi:ATP-dependent exoDNAse (exonuclease V) beta subunit|nr:UvrD-helicase domain-containing protein [Bacteroidales bacterium]MDI9516547.1 UvrD-helicase domain-containing protein [Bacteroidota bacterium]NLH55851.1 UvrD-helicase domain-containing protein [Rikenellaceae bacterium]OQC61835.1 MAG: ATP-dependent helicase/nuclease subunit A [Bacteroidetes bacterium ADurb.Bin008]HNV80545.1 UvrD-helicase domain-containing protein [Tenuifilaceae bacterium]
MSQLVVYSASAGSGKTFRLAAEYIKQVIEKPESFKNILAVTFTNKATAEMKERILNELHAIAQGEKSAIANEIADLLPLTQDQITQNAQRALSLILHDYSRFSISTIDSFVQRVIQSLLWEIGEQGGFDIKLDSEPIIEQAADDLIDSASTSSELMRRFIRMGEEQMDEGKTWDIRRGLMELGKQIFTESFRTMDRDEMKRFTHKESIDRLKKSLYQLIDNTISKLNLIAQNAIDELTEYGVTDQDFAHRELGIMGFFYKCAQLTGSAEQMPNAGLARVQQALNDPTGQDWVTKSTFDNKDKFARIELAIANVLYPSLVELVDLIQEKTPAYVGAKLILKHLDNLALISDLWTKIRAISKEEGFLLLNESNHLLQEFVKESDTPFIYEKVGTRYDVIMIDEFQDTSVVQWHNFIPLVKNSLSQGYFSMIVGDVKQSIYRWRNSDWKILASGVDNDLASHGIERHSLKVNRRSLPAIVDFNNRFFESAKDRILQTLEELGSKNSISALSCIEQAAKAYKDIRQDSAFPQEGVPGNVEVCFIDANKDEYSEVLSEKLTLLIENLRLNYKLGDIAILVRTNKEGQRVADMLLEHNRITDDKTKHIHFISQDGLLLKASSLVKLMIAAFRLAENPLNKVARSILSKELFLLNPDTTTPWHNLFVERSYIEDEALWLSKLNSRPLNEVFEAIAHRYELFSVSRELAYLTELHEHILNLSAKGGSDIGQFLSWWDENSENLSLSSSKNEEALSILTIHKAKGLQFPVVIIPFADWNFRKPGTSPLLWVSSNTSPFDEIPRYPIHIQEKALSSIFAAEAIDEYMRERVDNLNLMYVAFTRPQNELYIFSNRPKPSKNSKGDETIDNIAKLLWQVVPEMDNGHIEHELAEEDGFSIFQFGKRSGSKPEVQDKSSSQIHWQMDNYPVGMEHGDVKLRMEAGEFFLSSPSERLQHREHGKLMHEILSRINTADDVEKAINALCIEGLIDAQEKDPLVFRLRQMLTDEPIKSWFATGCEAKTEATILTPQGQSYRPDRVIIDGNDATVVDFKFGTPNSSHGVQVNRYASLLRGMGFEKVKGFIWYVDANCVTEL